MKSTVVQTGAVIALVLASAGWTWQKAIPEDVGLDTGRLEQARDYALTGEGSGCIVRGGKVVMSWGDQKQRYDLKSSTKSIGVTALGLAMMDGRIALDDKAGRYHSTLGLPPESNRDTGWIDKITILHLATQTAGFEKPGGYGKLLFEPGTKWLYSDAGPNWLAECITNIYKKDVSELMFERVFGPLGIGKDDLTWRKNSYRPAEIDGVMRREFGSGISANVDAMARIGLLYLHGGMLDGRRIIGRDFVEMVATAVPKVKGVPAAAEAKDFGPASSHYGLLWWNNADGTIPNVPKDTYWSWGLYDSLIVVMPSLDIVAARAGKSWQRTQPQHYAVLIPFLEPIATSVIDSQSKKLSSTPPYPPSPIIKSIRWASAESVIRKAEGSDNWPVTWADDDAIYTAYGDGWGFEPKVDKKLSLGFARITGSPEDFEGVNIRSATGEQTGQGAAGRKASGMLCVDGVLYMLVRNADNSQIACSPDHGRTWQWCQWKFTEGFGCPVFLNFGKGYDGARDGYVYIYSQDADSAYKCADTMNLARVPRGSILERDAYEYFVRTDDSGRAVWSGDTKQRGAVFRHTGKCYRSSVCYNEGIKRYLWWRAIPDKEEESGKPDARFEGGLGIYDAPEPWGPWTTAYYTDHWDIGPGESGCFPTKWISADGRTMYLVFSGDDSFSVRKAKVELYGG
jgi:CubicO group peptidase (beta-lactamase class C family)